MVLVCVVWLWWRVCGVGLCSVAVVECVWLCVCGEERVCVMERACVWVWWRECVWCGVWNLSCIACVEFIVYSVVLCTVKCSLFFEV